MDVFTLVILFVAFVFVLIGFWFGKKYGLVKAKMDWQKLLPSEREDAVARSRAVLSGQFSEQLAPYLPDFPYKPTEVRFLGKPIDFIVFEGMDEKNIQEVVFVEVKSGDSQLSTPERTLKKAIEKGKVRWEEYRVVKGVTRK
ncbi:MAG TPA: Holliday junction resolvase-like protein [Candidatus Nanoarchaeia archaeon]|nr:Holliday junction resolvase-like protein [Candidatus Nanoarchaeia archaeon]